MGMSEDQIRKATIMKGRGCNTCNNTGYKGRVALYEVMPFTDPLKELVLQGASGRADQDRDDPRRCPEPADGRHRQDPRGHDHARRGPAHHGGRLMPPTLQALLKAMTDKGASDLHVTAGSPPRLRIDNELVRLQTDPLTPVDTKTLCYSVMNDAQKLRFEEDLEIDFSFGIRGMARFRANVYLQQSCVAGAFRIVPYQVSRSRTSACRRWSRSCATGRAAWSWSPGRPARASRPRWRR